MPKLNDEVLRTVNNAPKGEQLSVSITSEKLYALGLNTVNNLVISASDGQGGTTYRRLTFKRTNSAPAISGQDEDLGQQTGSFAEEYTVTDVEGDNVVVTEFIDDKQIRSYQATLGQEETIELSRENWLTLTNGAHQLRVEAVDGNFATSVRVWNFSKKETVIAFQFAKPEETDARATKMKAIQEARTKIEFSVPDLDTQLEHRQDNSKLAYAKLELPASPWELLDALDKARLPEGDSLYLEIIDYHDFEVLRSCHTCSATNLPELNDLAERLSRLDERQHTAFEGLVRVELQKQEPLTLKRLRDLAASADCCHVVESVVSDGQLGRFYAENGFVPEVEGLPDAVFELLDFEKIGEMARTGECGVYVPSGISDLGGYVVQHSDLNSAPEILLCRPVEPDYAIHLRLAARHEDLPFGGTDVVELKLPAEDSVLEMAVRCLGYVDWGEVECTCLDCKVPQLKEHITSAVPFETIKQLGDALTQMPTQWQAVMELEDCHRLDYALDLSQNLHCYNWYSIRSRDAPASISAFSVRNS